MREGDTLVVPKLDGLARSVPDARAIADRLRERGVKLALGRALYDPGDSMGKMFFNILATFAEFEADLIRLRTREGHGHRPSQGKIVRQAAQTVRPTAAGTLPYACHRRVFHQRSRRALLGLKTNRLSHAQPEPIPLSVRSCPLPESTPTCLKENLHRSMNITGGAIAAHQPHAHPPERAHRTDGARNLPHEGTVRIPAGGADDVGIGYMVLTDAFRGVWSSRAGGWEGNRPQGRGSGLTTANRRDHICLTMITADGPTQQETG